MAPHQRDPQRGTQRDPQRRHRTGALLLAACCALTAACAPLDALTGADTTTAAPAPLSTAGPVGDSLVLGSGVPQPTPSAPVPAPTATQDTTTFVTVTATPQATGTASPSEECRDFGTRSIVGLGVSPAVSPGSVALTWHSRKGASLRGWRIAAARQDLVSGQQPPLVWKDVAAPPGCTTATTTFTGLTSGSRYEFWLHALVDDGTGPDPLVEMVGRSPVVTVP